MELSHKTIQRDATLATEIARALWSGEEDSAYQDGLSIDERLEALNSLDRQCDKPHNQKAWVISICQLRRLLSGLDLPSELCISTPFYLTYPILVLVGVRRTFGRKQMCRASKKRCTLLGLADLLEKNQVPNNQKHHVAIANIAHFHASQIPKLDSSIQENSSIAA